MRKIPTLYHRDPANPRHVDLDRLTPGCEWVLNGEGVPTRKWSGTCTMLDEDGRWWARREVRPGKPTPPNFVQVEHDENTGKTFGWEPIEQSAFAKAFASVKWLPVGAGTYELVGPKINGNPDRLPEHRLEPHGAMKLPLSCLMKGFEKPINLLLCAIWEGWEGLVWHHPDGRMTKLKVRDIDFDALENRLRQEES